MKQRTISFSPPDVTEAEIAEVAEALRSTFRSNDITMRLGGDEFGVFAVGITKQKMAEAMQCILLV